MFFPHSRFNLHIFATNQSEKSPLLEVTKLLLFRFIFRLEDKFILLILLLLVSLIMCLNLFICSGFDDALFGVMESICCLVETIPEHELMSLTCGTKLLLLRAHR